MINRLHILITISIFMQSLLNAQITNNCQLPFMTGYILDGQSYKLVANESPSATIHMVFFSGFVYRIHFCSTNTQKYKITIYDIEHNLIFTDQCNNYTTYYDLQFKSDIACIIEVESVNSNLLRNEYATYYFTIGFKEKSIFGRKTK